MFAFPENNGERIGEVFSVPADLRWGRRDVITQADVCVMAPNRSTHGEWAKVLNVPVVVEMLSPSTARYDRFGKQVIYREQGVESYWIIDADTCVVGVWTPDAQFQHSY